MSFCAVMMTCIAMAAAPAAAQDRRPGTEISGAIGLTFFRDFDPRFANPGLLAADASPDTFVDPLAEVRFVAYFNSFVGVGADAGFFPIYSRYYGETNRGGMKTELLASVHVGGWHVGRVGITPRFGAGVLLISRSPGVFAIVESDTGILSASAERFSRALCFEPGVTLQHAMRGRIFFRLDVAGLVVSHRPEPAALNPPFRRTYPKLSAGIGVGLGHGR